MGSLFCVVPRGLRQECDVFGVAFESVLWVWNEPVNRVKQAPRVAVGLHSAAACVQPGSALHAHSSSAHALQAHGYHTAVPLAAMAAQLQR